ncbi:hypothetical protein IKG68_01300, partial [Candidatus Saccharibacteria bacterium]|nr:hypothetical protein [Candidatus Saccharibacteria bacterium]
SSGNTATGYAGLPLDNNDSGSTGVKLLSTDSYASSGSIKFKIGAKATDTQVVGTYTGTVNFYAVTNPSPITFDEAYAANGKTKTLGYYTLQDTNSTICSSVEQGQTTQVIDIRDNTVYHIGKLADNRCWMLDNLALDLLDTNILNSLSSANTNIDQTNEAAILKSLKEGNRSAGNQYANGAIGNLTTGNSYSVARVNLDYKDTVPDNGPINRQGNNKVGGYYNYCAASAGSYCYGNGTSYGTSSGNATSDICSKGWRIPTGNTSGEYSALANTIYGSTGNTSDATAVANYRNALSLLLSGYFYSGSPYTQGSYGRWWSSTRYANGGMYYLHVDTDVIDPATNYSRLYGLTIRCILGS